MANPKGTPQNLMSIPRLGKEPLSGVIPIRVWQEDAVKLKAMGKDMQPFIRNAIAKALEDA